MKFGIKEECVELKTDILGRVVSRRNHYRVYRSFCFGLFRLYMRISPERSWMLSHEVFIDYCPRYLATSYSNRGEAEALIECIRLNPSRFVRVSGRI